ncbi:aldehyde dehydrogenase family protein [Devriesea agamarum]|uniref:aldehyde dehydrogenase family protein n=1 Tax=Devriesea agamarum TaxID=472569 RepID=UPI000A05D845|nr:aldehyde dehydrogenase family protein [Devriesea agamarum]
MTSAQDQVGAASPDRHDEPSAPDISTVGSYAGSCGEREPEDVPAAVAQVMAAQREAFEVGCTASLVARRNALIALRTAVLEETPAICRALHEDLGKSADEARVTEISLVVSEIDHMLKHFVRWLNPQRLPLPLSLRPATARLWREPLGVCLVIAPWNYPVQLALAPLVAAIAGGNSAVLAPSELAPATSRVLHRIVSSRLPTGFCRVIEGGADVKKELLRHRFDHIFYTGGARVGRIVARAAAEHLSPVTLELGGKSPVYVGDDLRQTELEVAARHIAWGKFTNAGQTCVAPDYVMASPAMLERLVPALRCAITAMYGENPATSPDYGRIISAEHHRRLVGLLNPDRIVHGGQHESTTRYLAPTVMAPVTWDDDVMADEIFGPILPLVAVDGPAAAIHAIRSRDKPLTIYVFTRDKTARTLLTRHTSSGSVVMGMTLAHLAAPAVPFGGVGESGYGAYHGRTGLETFTHAKPVVVKPLLPDTLALGRPPIRPAARAALKALGVVRGRDTPLD